MRIPSHITQRYLLRRVRSKLEAQHPKSIKGRSSPTKVKPPQEARTVVLASVGAHGEHESLRRLCARICVVAGEVRAQFLAHRCICERIHACALVCARISCLRPYSRASTKWRVSVRDAVCTGTCRQTGHVAGKYMTRAAPAQNCAPTIHCTPQTTSGVAVHTRNATPTPSYSDAWNLNRRTTLRRVMNPNELF